MGLQDARDGPAAITACDAIDRYCMVMERRLEDQPFLCGSAITYVDIAFYMAELFAERMGAPLATTMPKLLEWRERMSSRPSVRTALAPLIAYLRANNRPVAEFLVRVETGITAPVP